MALEGTATGDKDKSWVGLAEVATDINDLPPDAEIPMADVVKAAHDPVVTDCQRSTAVTRRQRGTVSDRHCV
jgi:hypothetical protein